jgi:hypothetical protein
MGDILFGVWVGHLWLSGGTGSHFASGEALAGHCVSIPHIPARSAHTLAWDTL